jgi:hypothetical protein
VQVAKASDIAFFLVCPAGLSTELSTDLGDNSQVREVTPQPTAATAPRRIYGKSANQPDTQTLPGMASEGGMIRKSLLTCSFAQIV